MDNAEIAWRMWDAAVRRLEDETEAQRQSDLGDAWTDAHEWPET